MNSLMKKLGAGLIAGAMLVGSGFTDASKAWADRGGDSGCGGCGGGGETGGGNDGGGGETIPHRPTVFALFEANSCGGTEVNIYRHSRIPFGAPVLLDTVELGATMGQVREARRSGYFANNRGHDGGIVLSLGIDHRQVGKIGNDAATDGVAAIKRLIELQFPGRLGQECCPPDQRDPSRTVCELRADAGQQSGETVAATRRVKTAKVFEVATGKIPLPVARPAELVALDKQRAIQSRIEVAFAETAHVKQNDALVAALRTAAEKRNAVVASSTGTRLRSFRVA